MNDSFDPFFTECPCIITAYRLVLPTETTHEAQVGKQELTILFSFCQSVAVGNDVLCLAAETCLFPVCVGLQDAGRLAWHLCWGEKPTMRLKHWQKHLTLPLVPLLSSS